MARKLARTVIFSVVVWLWMVTLAPTVQAQDEQKFVHPGLFSSQDELIRIRLNVNGPGEHPMQAAWGHLRKSSLAKLTYAPHPYRIVTPENEHKSKLAFRADARAAYTHALQWVITGDHRHSAKAIEIYNAWSGTFEAIQARGAYKNLTAGWETPIWLAGAEIIRHFDGGVAGWSADDVAQFERMVQVLRKLCMDWEGNSAHPYRGHNIRMTMALARISLGIYLDDAEAFSSGRDLLTKKTFGRDDHSIDRLIKRIHGEPVTLMELTIGQNGEVMEFNRQRRGDCGHANMSVSALLHSAELLWHQGIDIYQLKFQNDTTPRIVSGMEYFSRSFIEPPVQTTHVGKVTCRPHKPAAYEFAVNHYRYRLKGKYKLPKTDKVMSRFGPVDATNSKSLPWPTLTHSRVSESP